jgi:hypothetical protein
MVEEHGGEQARQEDLQRERAAGDDAHCEHDTQRRTVGHDGDRKGEAP